MKNLCSSTLLKITEGLILSDAGRTKCSILIPTYNELKNVLALFEKLKDILSLKGVEVVFIDDDSPDGTAQMIKKMLSDYSNVKLLVRSEKKGLGSAYKDGFRLSSGEFVITMDADLSYNPQEVLKLIEALNHADIVIGSRYISGGRIVEWEWYRKIVSRVANLLARFVLGIRVRDATSGFRAYRRVVFKKIVSLLSSSGFEFQIETLYIAKKLGFKVVEVPITFTTRKKGRSKLGIDDIIKFALSIIKMRFR